MAKKGQKRSTTKKVVAKSAKAAPRPAGKAAPISTAKKAPAPAKRPAAVSRPAPAPAGPTLGEQAQRLRDDILRSKLTHPDPWRYASKARTWGERAQALMDQVAAGRHAPGALRDLEALAAELQVDRDFQEARRLF